MVTDQRKHSVKDWDPGRKCLSLNLDEVNGLTIRLIAEYTKAVRSFLARHMYLLEN